ncbi:type II toxin-antitoxin system PemK/MazF family toxin [Glycocaulis abyssi]|uniref:Type II toxin-antitoxin system PemK/MazF family toxin n=1 Tax=Glycocaulis abyssi TaxID=1433403 RepID=A0ABV9NBH9_9PROT
MAINEHPEIGTVLMCDFDIGFREPEMVKRRPVIVVSPKIRARPGLCTIVALSTTAPDPVMQYHCRVGMPGRLPDRFKAGDVWVKGDMIAAVGFHRLDLIRIGRTPDGRRRYCFDTVSDDDLKKIRKAILAGIGLAGLTKSL